jgi:hypothetical protein
VRGFFTARFFEDTGDCPDAACLVFKATQAGFATSDDTEVVLFGDGLPERLCLGRRDFAVGTQDQTNARAIEADLVDPRERVDRLVGGPDLRTKDCFETAAHFLIDLRLRSGVGAVVDAFSEVLDVGKIESVVIFAMEIPRFATKRFESVLKLDCGSIGRNEVFEHLRFGETFHGVDRFGKGSG